MGGVGSAVGAGDVCAIVGSAGSPSCEASGLAGGRDDPTMTKLATARVKEGSALALLIPE